AGLFEDLAHGRLGEHLARIDLALGQRDVAVTGAVDQQHHELLVDDTPDDTPGRVDRGLGHRTALPRRRRWTMAIVRSCRSTSDRSLSPTLCLVHSPSGPSHHELVPSLIARSKKSA